MQRLVGAGIGGRVVVDDSRELLGRGIGVPVQSTKLEELRPICGCVVPCSVHRAAHLDELRKQCQLQHVIALESDGVLDGVGHLGVVLGDELPSRIQRDVESYPYSPLLYGLLNSRGQEFKVLCNLAFDVGIELRYDLLDLCARKVCISLREWRLNPGSMHAPWREFERANPTRLHAHHGVIAQFQYI